MGNGEFTKRNFNDLRQRAQAYLSAPQEEALLLSQEAVKKLIHELGTYQVELELQNEDLRRTQQDLETSRRRISDLYDFAPVGYLTISGTDRIVEANLTAAGMVGIERDILLNQPVTAFITHEDQDLCFKAQRELRHRGGTLSYTAGMRKKDGTKFFAHFKSSINPELDGHSGQYRTIITDITEQKRLEEELLQSHKMQAMGTLAGGIAHDFNNILAAMLGYSELIRDDLKDPDLIKNYINQVISAGNRAVRLINQILTFSRKGHNYSKEPLQPQILVKEILKMLKASFPATLELREIIDPNCHAIWIDPTGFHQVLMNLCTNAFQASVNERCVITVQLSNKILSNDDIGGEKDVTPGPFVELLVSDTCCGMDKSVKDHIFEPYYTTKSFGKGSGIGLAVVYGVIKSHKGMIKVESEPGKGSCFRVYFPSTGGMSTAEVEVSEEEILPTGTEHILIVDNEKMIVDYLKSSLERLGYTVTAHTKSLEALNDFNERPEIFDLVITDQTMAQLTGVELSKEIRKVKQKIPIILCTGYSSLVSEKKAKEWGIEHYVIKPINRKKLAELVHRVLKN